MSTATDIPQLAPLYSGPTMSPELEAKLAAKAEQADAERAANESREAKILVASTTIPGSLADLREVSHIPGAVSRFDERAKALRESIERGEHPCCGEWQMDGYYGWCSLLGRPTYFQEIGRDQEDRPILRRCDRCPVALRKQRHETIVGGWFVDLVSEIEAICEGNIDVWTGYGYAE